MSANSFCVGCIELWSPKCLSFLIVGTRGSCSLHDVNTGTPYNWQQMGIHSKLPGNTFLLFRDFSYTIGFLEWCVEFIGVRLSMQEEHVQIDKRHTRITSVFILGRRVKTFTVLSKGMFWRDYQNISLLLAHSSFIKMRELKWYLSTPSFRKWCQNWHLPTKHLGIYWTTQFSYRSSQGKRVCPAFPEVLSLKSCPLCAHPLGYSCQTHCKAEGSGSRRT